MGSQCEKIKTSLVPLGYHGTKCTACMSHGYWICHVIDSVQITIHMVCVPVACPKLCTTYTYGSLPCTLSSLSFTEVYVLSFLSVPRAPDLLCPSIVLMSQSLGAI